MESVRTLVPAPQSIMYLAHCVVLIALQIKSNHEHPQEGTKRLKPVSLGSLLSSDPGSGSKRYAKVVQESSQT